VEQGPPRRVFSFLRLGLAIVISGLALYLAFHDVPLQEVAWAISQADGFWVGLALISVGVNTVSKVFRWRVLLRPVGAEISFGVLLTSFLSGQMLNAIFPIRVGDLSRIFVVGREGPGGAYVLGTVVLEKIIDLTCYVLLFLGLLLAIPLPGWLGSSGWVWLGMVGLLLLAVLFVTYQRNWLMGMFERGLKRFPAHLQESVVRWARSGLDSLEVLQQPAELAGLAIWTAVIWGTAMLTNQLVLLAFDIHLPWTASLLIVIGLIAGISIPSLPGRIGIFEMICILALQFFGVQRSIALSYGILLHAVVYLPVIFFGILSFWWLGLHTSRANKT
jgi:hypothetical protein